MTSHRDDGPNHLGDAMPNFRDDPPPSVGGFPTRESGEETTTVTITRETISPLDRHYKLLMLVSMLLELVMLGWIAWHTH